MKVLVSINIPDIGVQLLRDAGFEVTAWSTDLPMTREQLLEACLNHDALLSSSIYKLDRDFLQACQHLRIISQFSAGYDNIDLEEAQRLGIPFANAPNAMTDATADVAFGLLLAVARKLFFLHKKIINGQWGHFRPKAHLGQELTNKTVGILGMGNIGTAFAKRCKGAYDMEVLYHNRTRNAPAEATLGARYVSFEALLQSSDIISVHAGLNDQTRGLFDYQAFAAMKPSAIFINTARGGIHNEPDLIRALNDQQIWGAGLDVTNPEPMKPDNPLLNMENVAVTPHIGSASVIARDEMARLAAMNIIEFARGEEVGNLVGR